MSLKKAALFLQAGSASFFETDLLHKNKVSTKLIARHLVSISICYELFVYSFFQSFTSFELRCFASWNIHRFSCQWVHTISSCAICNFKRTKTYQLYFSASFQFICNYINKCFQCFLCVFFAMLPEWHACHCYAALCRALTCPRRVQELPAMYMISPPSACGRRISRHDTVHWGFTAFMSERYRQHAEKRNCHREVRVPSFTVRPEKSHTKGEKRVAFCVGCFYGGISLLYCCLSRRAAVKIVVDIVGNEAGA